MQWTWCLPKIFFSPINVPPFANSAMDGYALRVADLEQSNTLTMIGKSFAGIPFTGTCEAGQCVRITVWR